MTFGQAVEAAKQGKLVQRSGWNGKGMFVFIRPEFFCGQETFDKIVSVPDNAKAKIKDTFDKAGLRSEIAYHFTAYFTLFAADGTLVNGWLASQTDMLSEDWQIVE